MLPLLRSGAALLVALALAVLIPLPASADPVSVPTPPLYLKATPANASAMVSWVAPVSNGGSPITSYTVYAHLQAAPTSKAPSCTTTNLSCTVTGLTNATPYFFTAIARNVAGRSVVSAPSNTISPFGPPSSPSQVTASPGNNSLTVSWAAPSTNGGSPVTLYIASAYPSSRSCQTSGLTCVITGLSNNTPYTVSVVAKNAAGASPPSAQTQVTTPLAPPGPPTHISATASNGYVTVSWQPPTTASTRPVISYTVSALPSGQSCTTQSALSCVVYVGTTPGVKVTIVATTSFGASSAVQVYPLIVRSSVSGFSTNSWAMTKSMSFQVEQLAHRLKAAGSTQITVTGYASTRDSHPVAPAIALARALVVTDLLRSDLRALGVSTSSLTIKTLFNGWSGYVGSNHASPANQRVTVTSA